MRADAQLEGPGLAPIYGPVLRGPEDAMAWAGKAKVGWAARAVLALVLGPGQRLMAAGPVGVDLVEVTLAGCVGCLAGPGGAARPSGVVLVVARPGEPTAGTEADLQTVSMLAQAAAKLGIPLLDCLIVAEHRWRSLVGER